MFISLCSDTKINQTLRWISKIIIFTSSTFLSKTHLHIDIYYFDILFLIFAACLQNHIFTLVSLFYLVASIQIYTSKLTHLFFLFPLKHITSFLLSVKGTFPHWHVFSFVVLFQIQKLTSFLLYCLISKMSPHWSTFFFVASMHRPSCNLISFTFYCLLLKTHLHIDNLLVCKVYSRFSKFSRTFFRTSYLKDLTNILLYQFY